MISDAASAPRPGAASAAPGGLLSVCLRPLRWLVLAVAMATAVVFEGARPQTWRRPVRAELLRFIDLAGVRCLTAVSVMATLVGISLVTQALFWLEEVGAELDVISDVVTSITIREVAPLVVGLLMLGRGGLLILSELSWMEREGEVRALDAQGLDPFLVLVVPRVLALVISMFCLTLIFILVAFAAGYIGASVAGVTITPVVEFTIETLFLIGAEGALMLPLKTIGIGLAIGVVCSLSALERRSDQTDGPERLAVGFLRAVLAVFLVSAVVTLLVSA